MSKNNNASSNGIGLSGLLFIVFLILKLCNVITWSWWWITAPLWIPLGIAVICIIGAGIFAFISYLSS